MTEDINIPDEWWNEAEMLEFVRLGEAYPTCFLEEIKIVPLDEIQPPKRNPGVANFNKERMIAILKGIVKQSAIPPIVIHALPDQSSFKYALKNGFHRFYASQAAGFKKIPVVIIPYFDISRD